MDLKVYIFFVLVFLCQNIDISKGCRRCNCGQPPGDRRCYRPRPRPRPLPLPFPYVQPHPRPQIIPRPPPQVHHHPHPHVCVCYLPPCPPCPTQPSSIPPTTPDSPTPEKSTIIYKTTEEPTKTDKTTEEPTKADTSTTKEPPIKKTTKITPTKTTLEEKLEPKIADLTVSVEYDTEKSTLTKASTIPNTKTPETEQSNITITFPHTTFITEYVTTASSAAKNSTEGNSTTSGDDFASLLPRMVNKTITSKS